MITMTEREICTLRLLSKSPLMRESIARGRERARETETRLLWALFVLACGAAGAMPAIVGG